MNREIKFKAAYPLKTGTVIIDNVTVYANQTLGCRLEDFKKVLGSHYYVNFDENCVERRLLDVLHEIKYERVGEIVSTEQDDWICFEGKPLQFTGLLDSTREEIYEGHIVEFGSNSYVVEWDDDNYCWCLGLNEVNGKSGLRYYDPSLLTILDFIDPFIIS